MDSPPRNDIVLLTALTSTVIELAERIDGDLVDETTLAELRDLHERSEALLRRLATEPG